MTIAEVISRLQASGFTNAVPKHIDQLLGRGAPRSLDVDGMRLFDDRHVDRLAGLLPEMPMWR